jgi:Mn-dependent DtxR family transcriptional regulator
LGVDGAIAEEDACAMEHILRAPTLQKLSSFLEFIQTPQGIRLLESFRSYEKTEK